jgi:FMN-dependent NADH-azoreductase
VNSSPDPKGNTAAILNEIARRSEEKGAELKFVNLVDLQVSGCRGCLSCRGSGECRIKDDMQGIVEELRQADVLLLGSPIYMGAETGQTKCFIDRLYCLFQITPEGNGRSLLPPGKRAVTVLTCNLRDGDRIYAYENTKFFKLFVGMLGFDSIISSIVPGTSSADKIWENYHAVNVVKDSIEYLLG